MKKYLVLVLCVFLVACGTSKSQRTTQDAEYHALVMRVHEQNFDAISWVPFEYKIEYGDLSSDNSADYTLTISDASIAMFGIRAIVFNESTIRTKDNYYPSFGIYNTNDIQFSIVPNQLNSKDGYLDKFQISGTRFYNEPLNLYISWYDSTRLEERQLYIDISK